jgi:hypothetical protein
MKASPSATAIASEWSTRASASSRRPAPSARAIADEMPPPIRLTPTVGHFQRDVFVEWRAPDWTPTVIVLEHPHFRCPMPASPWCQYQPSPSAKSTPPATSALSSVAQPASPLSAKRDRRGFVVICIVALAILVGFVSVVLMGR